MSGGYLCLTDKSSNKNAVRASCVRSILIATTVWTGCRNYSVPRSRSKGSSLKPSINFKNILWEHFFVFWLTTVTKCARRCQRHHATQKTPRWDRHRTLLCATLRLQLRRTWRRRRFSLNVTAVSAQEARLWCFRWVSERKGCSCKNAWHKCNVNNPL